MATHCRTAEFFAIADAQCGGQPPRRRKPPRSALATAATSIGRELHAARERIERLERLSRGTSLFNDPVVEIDQLKLLLKQDMHRLGAAIDTLARAQLGGGRQPALHRDAVAATLRSSLSAATTAFQQALAQREASLSAREQRAARLASVAQTPSLPLATSSALHRRPAGARSKGIAQGRGRANGVGAVDDIEAGGGSAGSNLANGEEGDGEHQQQTYWTPRSLREREAANSTMQSTLAELGGMFQKLSGLVAQQAEMVSRIDADLDDATSSIDVAQVQLTKYYRAIRGNRGLIIKAFVVLMIVIALWTVVGRKR